MSQVQDDAIFWRAIDVACGAASPEDVADVGRYVASRGETAVQRFLTARDHALTALVEAGVPAVLRRDASTADGHSLSDVADEVLEQHMEALLLAGEGFARAICANSEVVAGPKKIPAINLRGAVLSAQAEPDIDNGPRWLELPGDRRRDGELWIAIHLGMGPGLGGPNTLPWSDPAFAPRYNKAALIASLDDSWREWRKQVRVRSVDIFIEYNRPGEEPERVVLTRRGRSLTAIVHRDSGRLTGSPNARSIAEREAGAALVLVRDAALAT